MIVLGMTWTPLDWHTIGGESAKTEKAGEESLRGFCNASSPEGWNKRVIIIKKIETFRGPFWFDVPLYPVHSTPSALLRTTEQSVQQI